MGRKSAKLAVLRYALMLVVLSLGLSGCQTCRNIASRLHLTGRKPPTAPEVVPEPPPAISIPAPAPAPAPAPSPEPPRPPEPPTPEKALQPVYFDFDKAVLRDDARRTLDKNLEWLKANPTVRVQIEGHCDERGTEEYNLNLGERRANSVKDYLVKNGIEPSRLYTISYGEQRPVDPGHNETAWAKNRRAQFSRY